MLTSSGQSSYDGSKGEKQVMYYKSDKVGGWIKHTYIYIYICGVHFDPNTT